MFFETCYIINVFTMTIYRKIYVFCQPQIEISLFNLFNSVSNDWPTSPRRFSVLEGPQQVFFVLFPQESLFRHNGNSVHSSNLGVEMNCPLLLIEELYTFDNSFPTELVLEKCIQTFHVLVIETQSIHGTNFLRSPISLMWYLQMGKKHTLSSWRTKPCFLVTICLS